MKKILKLTVLLTVVALATIACNKTKSTLKGSLPEDTELPTWVRIYNYATMEAIDSIEINDHNFTYEFAPVKGNALYYLGLGESHSTVFFVPEKGTINLNFEKNIAEGTPENDILATYTKEYMSTSDEIGEKYKEMKDNMDAFEKYYEEKAAYLRDISKKFFLENKEKPLALVALRYYQMAEASMDDIKTLVEQGGNDLNNYKSFTELKEVLQNFDATKAGKQFTDLEGVSFDGTNGNSKPAKLSDYVGQGQFALIDFWASWCGPCQREIKDTLKPLYEKYRNKGLVIVGVAVWDKEEDHKARVKELDIKWPQIFDSNRDSFTQKYAVMGVPQIILVGPDGTILARDLRGEELVKAVESHFQN